MKDWRKHFHEVWGEDLMLRDESVVPGVFKYRPIANVIKDFIEQVEKAEYQRCVDLLDNSHKQCVIKESCIGYQNAQSDLINNPPI